MTASDARPPSDTGTTGWHIHANGQGGAWRDDHHPCENPRPVLVVDPAEARERVRQAVIAQLVCYTLPANVATYYGGQTAEEVATRCAAFITDAILAALAGQGQP